MRPDDENKTMNGTDMPLISIVTVVFNDRENLERTILSVLGQTYSNIEYIIIDGGSTDGTVDSIRRYEDRIARWVSEPDKGLYDAMNKGIRLASGDWINFMNAGDCFFVQDTVSTVARHLQDDADLVYGHCRMVFRPDFSVIWKTGSTQDLWRGMIFRHQSLFTRTPVCKAVMFDLRYRIAADFTFIYSCYRKGYRFLGLDLTVSSVVLGGLSDINLLQGLQENRRVVLEHEDTLRVRLYYGYAILLLRLKNIIKRLIPEGLINRVRTLKYG
jgi:glycosyltransferase involved in cell wall biosynthesis